MEQGIRTPLSCPGEILDYLRYNRPYSLLSEYFRLYPSIVGYMGISSFLFEYRRLHPSIVFHGEFSIRISKSLIDIMKSDSVTLAGIRLLIECVFCRGCSTLSPDQAPSNNGRHPKLYLS